METPSLLLLVRHAHAHAIDLRLAGRTPGVHLSERGHAELPRLRHQFAAIPLDAVYSSPLVRARETAEPIATDHGLGVDIEEDLNEVDFGDWTGATFDLLRSDPRWDVFNGRRATAVVPNGERPSDLQRRAVTLLTRLADRHRHATIAVVSHAEVIRSAVLWFAGRSLDDFHQFPIHTASVTGIEMSLTPRLLFVNALEASECSLSVIRAPERHT
jgi:broad specificity phosphatase PhoE